MLEKFLVHLLTNLAVLLGLNLLYLSIVYAVLVVVDEVLKSIVSDNQVILIGHVLSLLHLLLGLDHGC